MINLQEKLTKEEYKNFLQLTNLNHINLKEVVVYRYFIEEYLPIIQKKYKNLYQKLITLLNKDKEFLVKLNLF